MVYLIMWQKKMFRIVEVSYSFTEFRKHHLTPAFKELRKHGFHAFHKNIKCCQSCSIRAIPEDVSYVFYHEQDKDRFKQYNTMFLGFNFLTEQDRDLCLNVLQTHIPQVEWDGTERHRIQIFGA